MKRILHILNDGHNTLAERVMRVQAESNQIKVVDLSAADLSYESIIDDIFSHDCVVSWHENSAASS